MSLGAWWSLNRGIESLIGLMLVGRHFDELTIYRAAYALENG